jgi:hemoglobin-like flavoprotein
VAELDPAVHVLQPEERRSLAASATGEPDRGSVLQVHPMNHEQRDLVRASFARLAADADATATLFYAFLFDIDPDLRPLFKGDMARQRRLLMATAATVAAQLDRLDDILPAIRDLGRRHAACGIRDTDYDTAERALLLTLAQSLGPDFTIAVRDAWTSCYRMLTRAMQGGAAAAPPRFPRAAAVPRAPAARLKVA